MTNQMIIMLESVKLMEEGVLKGSGIKGTTPDGKEIELPEQIHTYSTWKALGYQVKKGSKAVASFPVWKYIGGQKNELKEAREDIDGEENEHKAYCRLRLAHFFTREQVEKIEEV